MKKMMSFAVLAGLLFTVGCASTQTETAASAANTPITLDQALQKAAQTRQQLEQAQTAYQNVKAAAKASKENNTNFETELAKQAVQTKINNAKQQFNSEVQEWKEILKN
jgi:F0F1-type ATP synthase membrane subunit b/b'